jgi:hypothetical protein
VSYQQSANSADTHLQHHHMLNKKSLLLSFLFLFIAGAGAFAQQQQKTKYVIYTFTVSHVNTAADVKKLDNFLASRKGVISSTTDLQKKTVEVKAVSNLEYGIIIKAVKSQGFEADEKHQTKYTDQ